MKSALDLSTSVPGANDGEDNAGFVSDSPALLLDERAITVPDALTCCDAEARSNLPPVLV
ncbi:hypothetical protein [Caballeronia sp.]|uniref:hypothetical protein n=1 Tax=Caballeronia sp. TaxID=1931223 RepID=UPI003C3F8EC7